MDNCPDVAMFSVQLWNDCNDSVVLLDELGCIVKANPAAGEMYGYDCTEMVGMNFKRLSPSFVLPQAVGGKVMSEAVQQRQNCTTFVAEISFYRTGSSRHILGIIRNASVQYSEEERLLYLSQAIEQSPSSVVITDLEGNITYVNPKFCEVTGYSKDEVQGQNPRVLKSGEQPSEVYAELWKTIKDGHEWRGEFHNKKKSGELYWEFASISPLRNACGKITGFLAIKEDITERKETSEALQKAEARLRQEILLAGKIQRSFLPRNIDNQRVQVHILYEPYHFVSGDTLDYFWLEGGRKFSGYIVDVMGHGVATALQTSALRVLGRQVLEHEGSLADRIQFFNRLSVSCFTEDSFAALIAFEFDFSTSKLTYVSAGINYFLAHTTMHRGIIKVPGTFLGMLPEMTFEEHTMSFSSGDRFYFFSDGLYDLMDQNEFANSEDHNAITAKLENLANNIDRMDDATAVFIKIPD